MRWVKASSWFSHLKEEERGVLSTHITPINDALLPFLTDYSNIILIRGGRGGGKSNTIALRLIREAQTEKYFRCYYGRKVHDRVRGSQFQELKKAIDQLHVRDEFYFSNTPNGSLTIIHKNTGNSFFAFGGDNAESLKSISDPTHIWCEEFDQFEESDFKSLYPTLRTIRGKNIFIGSFNSYEVLKDHWIVRIFFPHVYDGKMVMDYDILEGAKVSHYLINYTDNYFIDQMEYEKSLKLAAGGDADVFAGIARGDWGVSRVGNKYYHAFKRGLHVTNVKRLPHLPDHLGFDFNLVPYMTLVPLQINETEKEIQIRVYKEYCLSHPLNTTEAVATKWLRDHEGAITDIFYYGDAMGTRGVEGFGDEVTRFDPVRTVLFKYLYETSDRTTRRNEGVSKRQAFINKLLSGLLYVGEKRLVFMVDESCVETIRDFEQLQEGVNGKHKKKEKDEHGRSFEKLGHTSDVVEYILCELFDYLV